MLLPAYYQAESATTLIAIIFSSLPLNIQLFECVGDKIFSFILCVDFIAYRAVSIL